MYRYTLATMLLLAATYVQPTEAQEENLVAEQDDPLAQVVLEVEDSDDSDDEGYTGFGAGPADDDSGSGSDSDDSDDEAETQGLGAGQDDDDSDSDSDSDDDDRRLLQESDDDDDDSDSSDEEQTFTGLGAELVDDDDDSDDDSDSDDSDDDDRRLLQETEEVTLPNSEWRKKFRQLYILLSEKGELPEGFGEWTDEEMISYLKAEYRKAKLMEAIVEIVPEAFGQLLTDLSSRDQDIGQITINVQQIIDSQGLATVDNEKLALYAFSLTREEIEILKSIKGEFALAFMELRDNLTLKELKQIIELQDLPRSSKRLLVQQWKTIHPKVDV